jgi:hypothetical protein
LFWFITESISFYNIFSLFYFWYVISIKVSFDIITYGIASPECYLTSSTGSPVDLFIIMPNTPKLSAYMEILQSVARRNETNRFFMMQMV